MSNRWYGNLTNRLEEGRMNGDLHVGMDITMYYWSDRTCYYITDVINDKCIKVRRYHVIADRDCTGGMGHQDWVYFKTAKEVTEYLAKYGIVSEYERTDYPEETWAFRYGSWKREWTHTEAEPFMTGKQLEKIAKGQTVNTYSNLSGKVSFGVRDYYYDWEF